MIYYRKGDATQFQPNVVVAHICNNLKVWGGGFVLAVSRKLGPEPEHYYRNAPDSHILGTLQLVALRDREANFWVANMIAQRGVTGGQDKINYPGLETCLKALRKFCVNNGCTVQMPRIGCGLAGSTWQKILPYLEEHLEGVTVEVFDI